MTVARRTRTGVRLTGAFWVTVATDGPEISDVEHEVVLREERPVVVKGPFRSSA